MKYTEITSQYVGGVLDVTAALPLFIQTFQGRNYKN